MGIFNAREVTDVLTTFEKLVNTPFEEPDVIKGKTLGCTVYIQSRTYIVAS